MGKSTAIVRFADVIVSRDTQHAWVLRSNLDTLNMECECLRCGRVETLVSMTRGTRPTRPAAAG